MISHQTIFAYKGFRYLKVSLLVSVFCVLVYLGFAGSRQVHGGYGGTVPGMLLGAVSLWMVLLLAWLGVRKRQYSSRLGTVQGWLSAHIYLGIALILVATLHTGFEFGWNVHTAAYALLWAVIGSGIYGVVLYARLPRAITENLGDATVASLLQRIAHIDGEIRREALSLPDEPLRVVRRSVDATRIGGSLRQVLTGRDPRCPTHLALQALPVITRGLTGDSAKRNQSIYTLLLEKQRLLDRVRCDMRYQAHLDAWLALHVPLAAALLAALGAHIISVTLFR
jgi:hypothetical protein